MNVHPIPALVTAARPFPVVAGKSPWRLALLLAVGASASGILLTGISVWFLGAAAMAGLGPAALLFNFHTPAAFVRLFALGKTVGKYGERVVGHRAALLDQVRRRAQLFTAMAHAPSTRAASWQLGNQDRLSDYMEDVEDVEDVDYARLRVSMPAAVLLAGLAALTGATALLTPLALLPIAIVLVAVAVTLRRAMPCVAELWTTARSSHRSAGRRLGAALGSVVSLQAERAFAGVLANAFAHFSEAEKTGSRRGVHLHCSIWSPVSPARLPLSASCSPHGMRDTAAATFLFQPFSHSAGSHWGKPRKTFRASCSGGSARMPPAQVSETGPRLAPGRRRRALRPVWRE